MSSPCAWRQLQLRSLPSRKVSALLSFLLIPICLAEAADKLRLYDFEEGTPGQSTTSVADKITAPVLFADGTGLIEVTGIESTVPRILPAGNLMDVVDSVAIGAPDLEGFFGATATFTDVTSAPPTASFAGSTFPSSSTVALRFNGSLGFDDFNDARGSRPVFFDQDAYLNNDPIDEGVNTFESFNLLFQAWVKPDSSAQGSEQIVFEADRTWGTISISSSGFWEAGGFGGASGTITTDAAVVFDDWNHVALLRTGGGATFYVNGRAEGAIGGFFNNWPGNVVIGSGAFGFSPFTGLLDDYSISGTPLSGFDVAADLDFFNDVNIDLGTADINLDGFVDQLDYNIFAANAGFDNGTGVGDPFTYIDGDVDQNGKIDFFDFVQISQEAAANGVTLVLTTVPEPTGLVLVAVGGALLTLRRGRKAVVIALLFAAVPQHNRALADVVVTDDFFYLQATKSVTSLGGFVGVSHGGGQNGTGGFWDDRWSSIGGTTIVSDDATGGLTDGVFSAAVTSFASPGSLQRDFDYNTATQSASVIYFAADMKVADTTNDDILAEFGIASPGDTLETPVISLGITDQQGTIAPTFFAQLGGTTVTGNAALDADDALLDNTFQRIVGKLEINAVATDGDFNGDGLVDAGDYTVWREGLGTIFVQADYDLWRDNLGRTGGERLTVFFEPTGVETSNASILTVEADIFTGLDDPSFVSVATLNRVDSSVGTRPHFIDDIAVGTEWVDVATVDVPRLTLEVDTASGDVAIVNNTATDIDLAYYEILSDAGSLLPSWSSLADQGVEGSEWAENSPSATQLIESNFTDSTSVLASGGTLTLAGAYNTAINAQDLVARWGVKTGSEGLLNLADIVYLPLSAESEAVPEPAAAGLVALLATAFIMSRRGSLV